MSGNGVRVLVLSILSLVNLLLVIPSLSSTSEMSKGDCSYGWLVGLFQSITTFFESFNAEVIFIKIVLVWFVFMAYQPLLVI